MKKRGSGILLHITSLPAQFGIGDLGPAAYAFADFLAETHQSYWQILPLNPTDVAYDSSPYHSVSAFAGNPIMISPEALLAEGLLDKSEIKDSPAFPEERTDYLAVTDYKYHLFKTAYKRFLKGNLTTDFERFCHSNKAWLDDFALFRAIKRHFEGQIWNQWPREIRDRDKAALAHYTNELHDVIEYEKFLQFIFMRQWQPLKAYCNEKGISIIGDIPIYVEYDSCDVWTHPWLFRLDDEKKPYVIAGVPPDYFSTTGQLWGNPIYNWDAMAHVHYRWWIERIERALQLVDIVRIDHFRGLVAYWEVSAHETTAMNGRWVEVPVKDFLNTLLKRFPTLPIIAEDLGLITPDVREIIYLYDLPGMKILMFSFGEEMPTNPYIPHNLPRNCIVYTGTHDNNTVRGWFNTEAPLDIQKRLAQYLGKEIRGEDIHRDMMRLAMMSVANTAIIPMQDLIGLDETGRMNRPSTSSGNWRWRLAARYLTPDIKTLLAEMTYIYGRK